MGFTQNVVDGNIILAAWGNEIRDRTRQVFATPAERDSQWAAPPNGAECVTLDTGRTWFRVAGVWRAIPLFAWGLFTGTADGAGNGTIALGVTFPQNPVVVVSNANNDSNQIALWGTTASSVNYRLMNAAGTVIGGGFLALYWQAVG